MNKSSKSDNAYVDLAAERLAELFIEQAKYNRSHKDSKSPQIPQHIEQIKLHLRYSWDPVLVDGTNEYHYPMAVSRLMKQKYNKPVIYKWNVYKHSPNDQKCVYIGEAAILCPSRIQGYLTPGPTQFTNIRLKKLFQEYLDQKLQIGLEVLNLQYSTLGKTPIVPEDLSNKYTRRYVEAILITLYSNKGYTLLNL